MDAYDPDTVFSSIDRHGRYSYANQASITRWNLARLAEAMLPLFDENHALAADFANTELGEFESRFQEKWLAMMRLKLGLLTEDAGDAALVQDLLDEMHASSADFTNTFRALSREDALNQPVFGDWHVRWRNRLLNQPQTRSEVSAVMCANNPAVIPRNHRVEAALHAAESGDLSLFHQLLAVLAAPYDEPTDPNFTLPPSADSPKYVTYCGT
jgi:uncharacterized protein YdiU (UPF0061 family)